MLVEPSSVCTDVPMSSGGSLSLLSSAAAVLLTVSKVESRLGANVVIHAAACIASIAAGVDAGTACCL
jgi:hypothetical protein